MSTRAKNCGAFARAVAQFHSASLKAIVRLILALWVVILGSPAWALDASLIPGTIDRGISHWAASYSVQGEFPPNTPHAGYGEGASCAAACLAAGGVNPPGTAGCNKWWDDIQQTAGGSCGAQYFPCPPGYKPHPSDNLKCVRSDPVAVSGLDPGKAKGRPGCGKGNPCDVATGNKYQVEVDYAGSGPFPLRFERHYNSLDDHAFQSQVTSIVFGRSGVNWRTNYDETVTTFSASSTNYATVRLPDGGARFLRSLRGSWTPDPDVVLGLNGNGSHWTVTTDNDETKTYDARGRLVSIRNREGLTQTLTYYADGGPLAEVADAFGKKLTFTYFPSNAPQGSAVRLATMVAPGGLLFSYAYDGAGRLTSVTYPDAKVRQYHYGEGAYTGGAALTYALTGITDESIRRLAIFKYTTLNGGDTIGRGSETYHGTTEQADKHSFTFPSATITNVTTPLLAAEAYTFETVLGAKRLLSITRPCATCAGGTSTASLGYDSGGNVSKEIDHNGNLTCRTFDLTRNLETQRVEGLSGTTCPGTVVPSVTRRVDTEWHTTFRLATKITIKNSAGTLVQVTDLGYDPNGRLNLRRVTDSASGRQRTWTWAYTPTTAGPITRVVETNPRGFATTYDYYAANDANIYRRGNLKTITNAPTHVTTFDLWNAHGQPTRIVDPNGLVIQATYDDRQRLLSIDRGGEVTSNVYNDNGTLQKTTLPDASYFTFMYDDAQRLTKITDAAGNTITYTLDKAGNRTKQDIRNASNILVQTGTWEFSNLNRLFRRIGGTTPATQLSTYGFDPNGNLLSIVDPNSLTVTRTYDALDRLKSVTEPGSATTLLSYDVLDQVGAFTDPRSLQTIYTRNALGEQTQLTSPDTGTRSAVYDAVGNEQSSTDARGETRTSTYDALDNPLTTTYSDQVVSRTYHTGSYGKGRLTRIDDATGFTTWAWDIKGRLTGQSQSISKPAPGTPVVLTTGYAYNASTGQLTSITYPSGRVVTISYNRLGQVMGLAHGSVQLVSGTVWRPFGQPQS